MSLVLSIEMDDDHNQTKTNLLKGLKVGIFVAEELWLKLQARRI